MATSSFYLKVISANRVFFAGKCRSLIVPEFDGQKEILAHHEDMVIAIDEGQMKFQPEGSDEWIHAVVGMGFVEIVNNRVTLLVETAEKPEEIDVRRAEEAKQRAEERLRQKQSIHEYYHSRAALAYYSKLNIYLQVSYKEQFYMLRHPFCTFSVHHTSLMSKLSD
jgi:F-type H+-transporting ATPase subunit epsilon